MAMKRKYESTKVRKWRKDNIHVKGHLRHFANLSILVWEAGADPDDDVWSLLTNVKFSLCNWDFNGGCILKREEHQGGTEMKESWIDDFALIYRKTVQVLVLQTLKMSYYDDTLTYYKVEVHIGKNKEARKNCESNSKDILQHNNIV